MGKLNKSQNITYSVPALPLPPVAKVDRNIFSLYGRDFIDDYGWLKSNVWQQAIQNPEKLEQPIKHYLRAENRYTEKILRDTKKLQRSLFLELKARIKPDDISTPEKDGIYSYFTRYNKDSEYPIYCRSNNNEVETIFDANKRAQNIKEAQSKTFYDVSHCEHSYDHRYIAYAEDISGAEQYQIGFKDLHSDLVSNEVIVNSNGDFVWATDNESIYYVKLDEQHRPYRIYKHVLGTYQAEDKLVYEESDKGFFLSLDITESRRYITITANDHITSEVWTIDTTCSTGNPKVVRLRKKGIEYSISHRRDKLYLLTNDQNAIDFKISYCYLDATHIWQDYLDYRKGILIEDMLLFDRWLVRLQWEDGLPQIIIYDFDHESEHNIEFNEEIYHLELEAGYEYFTDTLRFSYSSLTTPEQIFDYDMRNRSKKLLKTEQIPSGHNIDDYVCKRIFAKADDGMQIPISLFYHRQTQDLKSAPLMITGYGSYGISYTADFISTRLSLVDRGFVFAIAHIRGGMELGYDWYLQGKLLHKKNTFTDFINCVEHLIDNQYCHAKKVCCRGGSAGGMLIGSIVNMRPDLFHAATALVPFVDVLNTMCDETLPLTPAEWPEWGNPKQDKSMFDYIASYSPYDNVCAQSYPHMLVTAGVSDPRVTYWEPAKWVAKLRKHNLSNNMLLLKTNMSAGHQGAAGRFEHLKEIAMEFAFLLKSLGYSNV